MKKLKKVFLVGFICATQLLFLFWMYTIGFKRGFNTMNRICDKAMCTILHVEDKCQSKPEFGCVYKFWQW